MWTSGLLDDKQQNSPILICHCLTSKYRHNTFEEYEEDYRPHIACFKFLENGKFSKVSSYDYAPCQLSLAVYDEETRVFLVLGYEDGTVAKASVEQLLRFED